MKSIVILLLIVSSLGVAQNSIEKGLDSISTPEAAKSFAKTQKRNEGKFFTFNKEKHKTTLATSLFKLPKGGRKVYKTELGKTYYKVIDKKETPHYRASMIVFDSKQKTKDEIDRLREKIISQYREGYPFEKLARIYSMDRSAKTGGDLGWFAEGAMHSDFEDAIKTHDSGDIFTLDIDDNNLCYVILKTHDVKHIEEISVLKVTAYAR